MSIDKNHRGVSSLDSGREQELVSKVSGARVSVVEVTPDLSA